MARALAADCERLIAVQNPSVLLCCMAAAAVGASAVAHPLGPVSQWSFCRRAVSPGSTKNTSSANERRRQRGSSVAELRGLDRVGVEIALDAIELFAQQRYLLRGDSGQCYPVHFHRVGQHHIPQPFSLGRETDVDLAAVL